jgi:translation initiation factor 1
MPLRPTNTRLVYSTGGDALEPADPSREPSPLASKGGVRIRLDRRASGRLVTVVTGLPGPSPEVEALGKALKSACGAGGTVKAQALEIQGDHRDKIETVLKARGLRPKRAGG